MGLTRLRTLKIAAASLFVLGLVWQHVQATRLGYAVEQARRQSGILKGSIATLEMQRESALSPAELAQAARSRLGMFPVAPESLRFLDQGRPRLPEQTLLGRWIARSWRLPLHT